MSRSWPPERRARQAELIRSWRPWEKSTGPVTDDGKETVSLNAYKGGHREKLRALSRQVNEDLRNIKAERQHRNK